MRFLKVLLVAGLALWGGAALASDAPPLTPQQADAVNKLIHDYLMNNPKVLAEALQHAEDEAKAADAAAIRDVIVAHRQEIERDPNSPVMGNPAGDVTLTEFFDYRCPYCKATAAAIDHLLQSDHKLRLVLKEYPVLGPDSAFAARVALVAARHGLYAPFHEAMFQLKEKATEEATLRVAKSVGLDPAAARKEAEGPEIDALLKNNLELAKTLKIDGTPTFIVGGTEIPGAVETDELEAQVQAARKGQS